MRSSVSRLGTERSTPPRRADASGGIFRLVASGLVLITKHVNPAVTYLPTHFELTSVRKHTTCHCVNLVSVQPESQAGAPGVSTGEAATRRPKRKRGIEKSKAKTASRVPTHPA